MRRPFTVFLTRLVSNTPIVRKGLLQQARHFWSPVLRSHPYDIHHQFRLVHSTDESKYLNLIHKLVQGHFCARGTVCPVQCNHFDMCPKVFELRVSMITCTFASETSVSSHLTIPTLKPFCQGTSTPNARSSYIWFTILVVATAILFICNRCRIALR